MGRTRIHYIYEMNKAWKDKNVVSLTCRILKLTLEVEDRKLLTRGGGGEERGAQEWVETCRSKGVQCAIAYYGDYRF